MLKVRSARARRVLAWLSALFGPAHGRWADLDRSPLMAGTYAWYLRILALCILVFVVCAAGLERIPNWVIWPLFWIVALASIACVAGTAAVHTYVAWLELCERERHAEKGLRFLCPECLRFGPFSHACGKCRREADPLVALTGGRLLNECPHCHSPLLPRAGRPGHGLLARCDHCFVTCDPEVYHGRQVQVIGILDSDKGDAWQMECDAWPRDPLGIRYSLHVEQDRVICLVPLSDRSEPSRPVPRDHALANVDALWLRAGPGDALSVGRAADRFLRLAGLSEAEQHAMPVLVEAAELDGETRRVLEGRFGEIRLGCRPADVSEATEIPEIAEGQPREPEVTEDAEGSRIPVREAGSP